MEMDIHYYEDFYFSLIKFQYRFYRGMSNYQGKIIFKDIGFPQEIILGADLMPVIVESMIGMLPPTTIHERGLDRANSLFYDTGGCSFHRLALSAVNNNLIPLPNTFVGLNACQEVVNDFFVMSNQHKIPFYAIDLPYERSNNAAFFVAKQYEETYVKLCEISGIEPDLIKLSEVIDLSNKAANYFRKANNIRKKYPGLIYGGQMLKFVNLVMLFGTEGALQVAQEYYETCNKYAQCNEKKIAPKCKILWCNMGISYDDKLYEYIEKELGAMITIEEFNILPEIELTTENPFLGLAERTLNTPFICDVQLRANNIIKLVLDYDVDGVVFFSHMNCRLFNSRFNIIKKHLNRRDIPIIELNGDCLDSRSYNRAQLLTRLEAFVEMISK
ncbi:benzoyl-CoA reductase/2-hydroxyglutaryl-CoA dehydratase subunit BcrC/BadD/HgdB [Kineothrix alysoides]|uniref:Benzoyl-CoA reductase/2-hydroxyglutaryl-CoA dehydratase subunit BcrC/BadD/HgdB n=1 Tax=Kineothrix alysoides TaxID=1469948 RepID=A0A4V2QBS9_9FIRM|nr:2-hydroxyacyl-CoA dehydratase family protein [Kineothrix alysoides]TCL57622.1 benzoyl-CoA reductase/2-hydroxyglutaryl-CoA dehydratase subunit BcrC/BadD/HgdB [Kineothrix alysoides]